LLVSFSVQIIYRMIVSYRIFNLFEPTLENKAAPSRE